jgi:hypothetical protein
MGKLVLKDTTEVTVLDVSSKDAIMVQVPSLQASLELSSKLTRENLSSASLKIDVNEVLIKDKIVSEVNSVRMTVNEGTSTGTECYNVTFILSDVDKMTLLEEQVQAQKIALAELGELLG